MKIIKYKYKTDIYNHEHPRYTLIEKNKEIESSKVKKFCCEEMKKQWNRAVTHNNGYGYPPQIYGGTLLLNIFYCPFCGEKIDYKMKG